MKLHMQGCNYSCAITTGDGKAIYAVGSDKKLKQLADAEGTGLITVAEYESKILITQIVLPTSAPSLLCNIWTWVEGGLYCQLALHIVSSIL